jgi:hypothetical protein
MCNLRLDTPKPSVAFQSPDSLLVLSRGYLGVFSTDDLQHFRLISWDQTHTERMVHDFAGNSGTSTRYH